MTGPHPPALARLAAWLPLLLRAEEPLPSDAQRAFLAPLWPGSPYGYTDPSSYLGSWAADASLEREGAPEECGCEEAGLRGRLSEELGRDPSFSGAWVHGLCGEVYGRLWAAARLDPETSQLAPPEAGCSAGLLAMAVVCLQSAALSTEEKAKGGPEAGWRRTERPLLEEGASVGDHLGQVSVAECLRLCEAHERCASVAHGPHGCHLKDLCVSGQEPLAPDSAPGYHTYHRRLAPSCPSPVPPPPAPAPDSGRDDLRLLMDLAMQLLVRAVHCLDASAWPLSAAEVLENRARLLELQLRGDAAFRWRRSASPGFLSWRAAAVPGEAAAVRRTLDRLLVRWARGLNSEVGFWHGLLDPGSEGAEEVDAASWRAARAWLGTGEVAWRHEGDVCGYLGNASRPLRVLNVGSGPLAPAKALRCEGREAEVVSADGLARFYMQLHDVLGQAPPQRPLQCAAEQLSACFPGEHFDVVHARNCLDHAGDPLLALREMLSVLRPGGWLLLRHARNEGVPGQFQLGLHQWAFDLGEAAESAGALWGPRFVVWNPALRADATAWLLNEGLAAEVRAELRRPPGSEGEGEPFVYVEARKPG